ncbi:MAG TPA: hypothetical protein DCW90_13375 [Lachnospiraceae bacterium]|nr:hypothetical protein [Lachnospiraceae bacterium]
MGTTTEKLQKLLDTKNKIKTSLQNKGLSPTNVYSEWPDLIDSIATFEDSVHEVTVTNKLEKAIEIWSYSGITGFRKDTVDSGAWSDSLHDGLLVLNLPTNAKLSIVGAKQDVTDRVSDAGVLCFGFTETLTIMVAEDGE